MAAHPIVIVEHGRVEIPQELQRDPMFQDGARLQLVPIPVSLELAKEDRRKAWENFRKLEGILAHTEYDPNVELENERRRELAEEARWTLS